MALAVGQVDPEAFVYWSASGEFVFVAILAGTADVAAPFVGAIVFKYLEISFLCLLDIFWSIT